MQLVNQKVIHKAFGEGTVIAQDGDYITVQFSAKESRFIVPDIYIRTKSSYMNTS